MNYFFLTFSDFFFLLIFMTQAIPVNHEKKNFIL